MDENAILTKLVQMDLCDPAFRPHVKTKKQNHCDSRESFQKMINDGLEFEQVIRKKKHWPKFGLLHSS